MIPLLHEKSPVLRHKVPCAARLGSVHRTREDNRRTAVSAMQVDFGQPVSHDVNVSRRAVVLVDADGEAVGAQDRDHASS